VITSVVAGYETAVRVGMAVMPSHYRYWHSTATNGTFGAAAAAANAIGLDGEGARTALGIALATAALAAFAALGWLLIERAGAPGLDAASLCPEDGPAAHLAILVDMTDPVSATQLAAARDRLARLIDAAPTATRVSLGTVGPAAEPLRSLCKPEAEVSALTANPRLAAERYATEFAAPVDATLDRLLAVPTADSSPILEAMARFLVAIPGFAADPVPREVVLVSDLVQHSDTFSFYRGDDWADFEAMGGPDRLARTLDGAAVRILRLPRPAAPTAVVDDFWVRYLSAQGAARVAPETLGDL
jgi:hypothetical protein